jgi:hypothetical protein
MLQVPFKRSAQVLVCIGRYHRSHNVVCCVDRLQPPVDEEGSAAQAGTGTVAQQVFQIDSVEDGTPRSQSQQQQGATRDRRSSYMAQNNVNFAAAWQANLGNTPRGSGVV